MVPIKRDTVVWSGLLLILVLAPLPSGSVSSLAQAALAFALFALLAISYTLSLEPVTQWPLVAERRFRLLMMCWTLAMAFAFFQVIPLPPKLIAALSPALSDLYAWTLPIGTQSGEWRPLSTTPAATVQNGLLIGAYAAAFILAVRHCRSRRRMVTLATTIILIGMGEAVYGLSQVGGKLLSPASGTFVNRNHFAALLIMALALSLGVVLGQWHEDTEARARRDDAKGGARLDRWARTSPLLVVSLILVAAVFFSFSRTGALTVLVMIVMFGIFGSVGSLTRLIGFTSLGIGAIAILLATGAWRALRIVAYRFESLQDSYRVAAWQGTYDIFQSSPLAGVGLGGLVDSIPRHLPTFIKEVFDHTHNEPLEILAEGGIIYASVFIIGLLIYFGTVVPAWLKRRDPLARGLGWGCFVATFAVFVFGLVEFPLRMPANALTLSVILSLAWVVVHHRFRHDAPIRQREAAFRSLSSPRLILGMAIIGMILTALTVTAELVDRTADGLIARAESMSDDRKHTLFDEAVQLYQTAQQIQPWQPAHAFKSARLFEKITSALPPISEETKSAWASAAASYERALRLHPANGRIQAALAWAALQSGDLIQARHAAQAAIRLAPGDPNVRFAVSRWHLVQWESLTTQDQQSAMAMIREGTQDLPLEYMEAIWRFVPDLKTIKSLLPDDLRIRRLLLGQLTERRLFLERWAEQDTHPALRILSPEQNFVMLSYGRLNSHQQPPLQALSAGPWEGMVGGWLSSGFMAATRVELPPGEAVIFIPTRGEAAGGIWPTMGMTLGSNHLPSFTISGTEWRTTYIHLYTEGGTFPLHAALTNGTVIQENGQFAERRAMLGLVRVLSPQPFRGSAASSTYADGSLAR